MSDQKVEGKKAPSAITQYVIPGVLGIGMIWAAAPMGSSIFYGIAANQVLSNMSLPLMFTAVAGGVILVGDNYKLFEKEGYKPIVGVATAAFLVGSVGTAGCLLAGGINAWANPSVLHTSLSGRLLSGTFELSPQAVSGGTVLLSDAMFLTLAIGLGALAYKIHNYEPSVS